MKHERPDKEDPAGPVHGLEKESGNQGGKDHPDYVTYGFSEEGSAGDLPFLKPPPVFFNRKDALKRDEAEEFNYDPGYPVLIPPMVTYPHKAFLKRRPAGQRLFIIVAEALSAAAIITIILTLFMHGPDTIPPERVTGSMAQATSAYTGEKSSDETPEPEVGVIETPVPPYIPAVEAAKPDHDDTGSAVLQASSAETSELQADVPPDFHDRSEMVVGFRAGLPATFSGSGMIRNDDQALMAFNGELPSKEDPGLRSNVEKFAARFFHEKIMKNEGAGDTPVTGIDLAEAWVKGVNRLLGTEMDFVRNTNEKGELVSVYFSSQTLKINAPVKREEPSL